MRLNRRNRYIFHIKRLAVRMSYYLGRKIQGYPAINKYTEFSTVWTLPQKADEQIIKYCEFDSSLMLQPQSTLTVHVAFTHRIALTRKASFYSYFNCLYGCEGFIVTLLTALQLSQKPTFFNSWKHTAILAESQYFNHLR